MYSPDNLEIISEIIIVSCITALSLFFGRKIASIEGPVRYIRGLLLLLYGLSWAFDLISCMSSSTNNGNYISCLVGFFNCVILHTVTKVVLYLYFAEKAYIISVPKSNRLSSSLYICNVCMLVPYIGIVIMMVVYRETLVSADYPFFCSIGYQMPASVAVLAYDFCVNLMFTGVFIKYAYWPNTGQQTSHQSSSLHMMAKRNIVVAMISALMTVANYGVIIAFSGSPRGLMTMTVSAIDVTVVAGVVQWATSHPAEIQCLEKLLQRGNGDKPVKLEIKQHQEVVVLTELASQRV
ncbi:hypothetical protein BC941DRAFT_463234 [Chlamydoabsidia padenii]|nr:hypothetical protein BC941DRAFT_463234 [Chlamydoabsidia padenii]